MSNYTITAMSTVLVAVGSTEAKRIARKQDLSMSPVMGGFILGIFLFAFGGLNEPVATKFCVLIIVSSLLVNGSSLFGLVGSVSKVKQTIPTPITH